MRWWWKPALLVAAAASSVLWGCSEDCDEGEQGEIDCSEWSAP